MEDVGGMAAVSFYTESVGLSSPVCYLLQYQQERLYPFTAQYSTTKHDRIHTWISFQTPIFRKILEFYFCLTHPESRRPQTNL